ASPRCTWRECSQVTITLLTRQIPPPVSTSRNSFTRSSGRRGRGAARDPAAFASRGGLSSPGGNAPTVRCRGANRKSLWTEFRRTGRGRDGNRIPVPPRGAVAVPPSVRDGLFRADAGERADLHLRLLLRVPLGGEHRPHPA